MFTEDEIFVKEKMVQEWKKPVKVFQNIKKPCVRLLNITVVQKHNAYSVAVLSYGAETSVEEGCSL